ncbi:hypothetical protein CLAIMM_03613, partial [Cladophialophora immunda]
NPLFNMHSSLISPALWLGMTAVFSVTSAQDSSSTADTTTYSWPAEPYPGASIWIDWTSSSSVSSETSSDSSSTSSASASSSVDVISTTVSTTDATTVSSATSSIQQSATPTTVSSMPSSTIQDSVT